MSEDYSMESSGEDHGSRITARGGFSNRGEDMGSTARPSPAPAPKPASATPRGDDAELVQLRSEVVALERAARDAEIATLKERKAAAEAKLKELQGQSKPVEDGVKKRR